MYTDKAVFDQLIEDANTMKDLSVVKSVWEQFIQLVLKTR
jgi:hypothetical protein